MEPPLLPRHRPEDDEIPDGMRLLYADLPERRRPSAEAEPVDRARVDLMLGAMAAAAGVAFVGSGMIGDLVRDTRPNADRAAAAGGGGAPLTGVPRLAGEADAEAVAAPVVASTDLMPAPEIEYAAPPAPAIDPPSLPAPGVGPRPIAPAPDPIPASPPSPDPEPDPAPTTTTTPPDPAPSTTTTPPDAAPEANPDPDAPPTPSTTTSTTTTTVDPVPSTTVAPTTTVPGGTQLFAASFGFAATPGMVAAIAASGVAGWVEAQLEPETVPDPVVDDALTGFELLGRDPADLRGEGRADAALAQARWAAVTKGYVGERQVHEALVGAWREFFAVRFDPADDFGHDQLIRRHGVGRFDDLLVAMAASPAVLRATGAVRVDAARGGAIPDGFARTMIERFTVGPTVATNREVRDAARVLSGWGVDGSGRFEYAAARHDPSGAQVLGWSTPGRSGAAGHDDGVALLRHLARRPETAHSVAETVCTRLVGSDVAPSLVARAALVYRENDTDLGAVVREILLSAPAAAGSRRGGEWATAALRAVGATLDIGRPWNAATADSVPYLLRAVGDEPGAEAVRAEATARDWWESPHSVSRRWSVARRLVAPDPGSGIAVSLERLRPQGQMRAAEFVVRLAERLGGTVLHDRELAALLAYLGVDADDLVGGAAEPVSDGLLADLAALILSFPSFMRRGVAP